MVQKGLCWADIPGCAQGSLRQLWREKGVLLMEHRVTTSVRIHSATIFFFLHFSQQ